MISEIGQKIKNLRTAADLTQDELAQRSGLTDGFISQVERGKTSISIDSLKMLLDALNVSLSDFFKEDIYDPVVFGPDDHIEINAGGACKLSLIVQGATNRRFEPALLELKPDSSTETIPPFEGDVFGYVLQGRVQLKIGSDGYRINAKHSFYFTAGKEYKIVNPYKRIATVLWLTSPPSF